MSELHDGTLAERVAVPARNVVPKPAGLSFEEAACLPTAYLTAHRMLTTRSGLTGPATVLVQGAGGGVASAAILLAKAQGHTVFCTSRDPEKRAPGARARRRRGRRDRCAPAGQVRPRHRDGGRGDLVALASGRCAPGAGVVVSGATSGPNPPADLNRVFFLQLSVVGSTMGTRDELVDLLALVERTSLRPVIEDVRPLADARGRRSSAWPAATRSASSS